MSDNKELINILKQLIKEYELKIKKLENVNNSAIFVYQKEIDSLKEDNSNIVNFDLSIVNEVLDELETPVVEKETITRYLKLVQQLLILNKEQNTSFKIKESQLEYIKIFLEKTELLKEKQKNVQEENLRHIGEISETCESYKKILSMVESKNRKTFIENKDIIENLLDENTLDIETKRKLLIGIMSYNQSVFENNLNMETMPIKLEKLNRDDLITLFNEYGYDFSKLKEQMQEDIINYGNIINIKELFDCFRKLYLPKFDLEKDAVKFVTILINCNKETFTNIINYSIQKGLQPKDLMSIVPALIGQTRYKHKNKGSDGKVGKTSPIINGRSEDYIENISFLESLGFNISYVYKKCKEILIMNHKKLVNNYKVFTDYGFTFSNANNGGMFDKALSCLASTDFEKVADQFIEICPDGHRYIRENLSRLKIVPADSIIFYNIYASYMKYDADGNYQVPEGPFVNENSEKLRLRGEITRLPNTGYETIPYRGVEEQNKKEKTQTINISLENKEVFDEAVEQTNLSQITDMTENDETLAKLDKYIDETDNARYNIDGVLISRLKVKRIYNILKNNDLENEEDALLYAITYNTIINQEDFDKIKKIVKSRRI